MSKFYPAVAIRRKRHAATEIFAGLSSYFDVAGKDKVNKCLSKLK